MSKEWAVNTIFCLRIYFPVSCSLSLKPIGVKGWALNPFILSYLHFCCFWVLCLFVSFVSFYFLLYLFLFIFYLYSNFYFYLHFHLVWAQMSNSYGPFRSSPIHHLSLIQTTTLKQSKSSARPNKPNPWHVRAVRTPHLSIWTPRTPKAPACDPLQAYLHVAPYPAVTMLPRSALLPLKPLYQPTHTSHA